MPVERPAAPTEPASRRGLTPTPGKTANPRRQRWRRQALTAGGAALVAAGSLSLWGWRYGFTALPAADPSDTRTGEAILSAEVHPDATTWPWLQAALTSRPHDGSAREEDAFLQTVSRWIEHGELPTSERVRLDGWLADHADLVACFKQAIAAPGGPRPTVTPPGAERTLRLLGAIPIACAARMALLSEDAGATAAALAELTDAYRFHALLTPPSRFPGVFDERGAGELDATVGRAFRRVALTGAALTPPAGRSALEALRRATNGVLPFEAAYAWRARTMYQVSLTHRAPNWRQVTRSFQAALLLTRAELGQVGSAAFAWMGGEVGRSGNNWRGVAHFRVPLGALARGLQQAVARPADYECLWRAAVGRAVNARPREEDSPGAPQCEWFGALDRRPLWWRWLDRPAVWQDLELIPLPEETSAELGVWLVSVEASRLTLALRLHREQHGEWPAALAELSPEVLRQPPRDPLTGNPFRYARAGTGWRLSAGSQSDRTGRYDWSDRD